MYLANILRIAGPEMAVIALGLFVLVADLVWKDRERMLGWLSVAGLGGVFAWTALVVRYGSYLTDTFVVDRMSVVFQQIFLAGAIIVILLSLEYMEGFCWKAEYLAIILWALAGMMVVASANELITLYVALEVVTISFFVLTAWRKKDRLSSEAGLKIYVQGFASSAVFIYGLSLFYGLTGTTYLSVLANRSGELIGVHYLAFLLVLAGIGFKLSLVPFHMWVPDVYQGAPTPITAFLSIASKGAALAVFVRLMVVALQGMRADMAALLGALAVVTMTLGNLVAIPQSNIKRLLGYSSIAHVGYVLLGLVMWNSIGVSTLMFYLIVYTFANLLAFGVVIVFYNATGSDKINDYAGLFEKNPFLAICLALALLSLGGIPPLAGFVGKFYLFVSAAGEGYLVLAAAGVFNTLISMYYYLNVVRLMFWGKGVKREVRKPIAFGPALRVALLITLILTIGLGLYPGPIIAVLERAASFLI